MTTDLSQLHPEPKFEPPFPDTEAEPKPSYWLTKVAILGVGLLGASGYAAFGALWGDGVPSEADSWLATPLAEDISPSHAQVPSQAWAEAEPPAEAPKTDDTALVETAQVDAKSMASPEQTGGEPGAAQAMPTSATTEGYLIQVASYHTKERADEHATQLNARGLDARVVAYGGPEAGWWHAVRLGPFQDRGAAEQRRFDLEKQERLNAYVLPRANGKYHVQVASFTEPAQAEQVAQRYRSQGHATKVTRVRMSGRHWHCVRIGPFDTRDEALAYRELVHDVPGSQSTVIPFSPPPGT